MFVVKILWESVKVGVEIIIINVFSNLIVIERVVVFEVFMFKSLKV